ncbi:MAG: glycosyltransferase family 39 protein [Anaerolineae bacterium]
MLGVIVLGLGLRLPGIGQVPPGLYHDEAYHGLDALEVLEGHLPLYFEANNGREPLFVYLVAGAVAILGRSPIAVRLPSVYIGILTLAATYDLARTLWGRRVGFWALAVLAVTLWHVHLSRVGFRAVLLPLFTALYLSQAAKAIQTRRRRHWVAAGFLYGVSWYTYIAARFTPVAIATFLIYGLACHRRHLAQHWRGALLAVGTALVMLLPLGIYTLAYPETVLARSGQVSVFSPEIHQGQVWRTLGQHLFRTLGMFTIRGDRIWRHNLAWRPVWGPALGLAFVLGVGVAIGRGRREASLALPLLWTAVMAIPTLLAEDAPHFLRGVGVLPTAALLTAVGLDWFQALLMNRAYVGQAAPPRWLVIGLASVPYLMVAVGLVSTTYDYFVRYASNPLAYHWFEAGPVELVGQINAFRGEGWTGDRMLHSAEGDTAIYLDREIWEEWAAIPFLLPESDVGFLPLPEGLAVNADVLFAAWPYRSWEPDVLPSLSHPSYLQVAEGPLAQGDLDPQPFSTAIIVTSRARPPVPPLIATFEKGIGLRAALVQPAGEGVVVQLWWEATKPITNDYTVFVHYLRDGERITQDDAQPGLGHLRTSFWRPGDLIQDSHRIPSVAPLPQRDTLRVGLYHAETGAGLATVDAAGNPVGDAVEVPVIVAAP